jgi:universal stress protein A
VALARNILIPIDFSPMSVEAVRVGREFASQSSRITLLHVYDYWDEVVPVRRDTVYSSSQLEEARKTKLEKKLWYICKEELKGIDTINIDLVVDRLAGRAICRYAAQNFIDLIIVATDGRTGISHPSAGSVAEEVLRRAPCPVLVLRPQMRGFSRKSVLKDDVRSTVARAAVKSTPS